jgi:hypothetical protein
VIGGLAETQEMLDFHADKGIVAAIEMAPAGGDARGCIGRRFSSGDTVTIRLVFILDQ